MPDAQLDRRIRGFAGCPQRRDVDFHPDSSPVREFLDAVRASRLGREDDYYPLNLLLWWHELWALPPRFVGAF